MLAGVSRTNLLDNNFYDGPFDQLADNYAEVTRVAEFMQLAQPSLRGRIDQYGYFKAGEKRKRVALTRYYIYRDMRDLRLFLSQALNSTDPLRRVSRGRLILNSPSVSGPGSKLSQDLNSTESN